MKKITKVISGLVLAASMICLASCSMITGLFSKHEYEFKEKSVTLVTNEYSKTPLVTCDLETDFDFKKGTKYCITIEGEPDGELMWMCCGFADTDWKDQSDEWPVLAECTGTKYTSIKNEVEFTADKDMHVAIIQLQTDDKGSSIKINKFKFVLDEVK